MDVLFDKACVFHCLSALECQEIIDFGQSQKWSQMRFHKRGDDEKHPYQIRFDENPTLKRFMCRFEQFLLQSATRLHGSIIDRICDDSRLLKYFVGQCAIKHVDRSETTHAHRKITAVCYLSDWSSHNLIGGGTGLSEFSAYPVRGNVLLFKSGEPHESYPVISGIKYALTLFMGTKNG